MNLNELIQIMHSNARRIELLVVDIPDEQARWKPDVHSWSILEVVNHLYDEEREDFRVRLDYFCNRPDETLPPIDPAGWVIARNYNERDLSTSLQNFLSERANSISWLKNINTPDWEATYKMPWGPMQAGQMIGAWVDHDLHHMRQLVELHHAYVEKIVAPYGTRYAGEW